MRRLTVLVPAIALVTIAGLWLLQRPDGQLARERGEVAVVQGDLAAQVETIGRIQALHEARLSLPTGGQVVEVFVAEGVEVTAGQPLLRLDPADAQMRAEEARLNLAVAEAQLARAEAGATTAEVEAAQARVQRMRVALAAAQAAYDEQADEPDAATSEEAVRLATVRADLQGAEADLREAVEGATPEELDLLQRQVELAQARLRGAQADLQETTLVAPFDGLITRREIEPGERIGPNQHVLTLAAPDTIRAVAEVDEVDVAQVAVGQPVTLRLDALPTQIITGTVEHVAPAPLPQRGNTVFETIIRLAGTPDGVRLGMAGTVTIATAAEKDALLLPLGAIRHAGRDTYVLRQRGARAEEVSVTLGPSDGARVVILDGLRSGDVVLLP